MQPANFDQRYPLTTDCSVVNNPDQSREISMPESASGFLYSLFERIVGKAAAPAESIYGHENPILPDEIFKQIIEYAAQNEIQQKLRNVPILPSIRQTSKKALAVANALQGEKMMHVMKEKQFTLINGDFIFTRKNDFNDDDKIYSSYQVEKYIEKFGEDLKEIDVSGISYWSYNTVKSLLRSLPQLHTFIAINSQFDRSDNLKLLKTYVPQLETLDLAENEISDESWNIMAHNSIETIARLYLHNLKWLGLRGNKITSTGAIDLANSEHMKNLQVLDLSDNKITSRGARALIYSENLPNLKTLNLRGNPIFNTSIFEPEETSFLKAEAKQRNITLII